MVVFSSEFEWCRKGELFWVSYASLSLCGILTGDPEFPAKAQRRKGSNLEGLCNCDTAEFMDMAAGILDYPCDTDLIGSER